MMTLSRLMRLARLVVAILLLSVTGGGEAANEGFVTVVNGQFSLNGAPFYFIGTNAYYLPNMASPGWGLTQAVDQTMTMATTLGITVLRTWGFCEGVIDCATFSYQPSPGVYNDEMLKGLDYVLWKADQAGIRVIVALTGRYTHFGGAPQILNWCLGRTDIGDWSPEILRYFTDPCPKNIVKNWINHLLNHRNFYNGRVYKNDPTILAWDLQNEPNLPDYVQPSGVAIRNWLAEMAAYVKSIDRNHLINSGEEGWDTRANLCGANPCHEYPAWVLNGLRGTSFTANLSIPDIDFGSIHLYPDQYKFDPYSGSRAWIRDHAAIARRLGKPLVIGEFGWRGPDLGGVMTNIFNTADTENVGGVVFWILRCANYCESSGHAYATQWPPATAVSDAIQAAAARAKAKSGGILPPLAPSGLKLPAQ